MIRPWTRYSLDKRDLIALALISSGYVIMVLLMPIRHNFAYFDDWTYANTVEKMLGGQDFRPSEYSQMTLATHAYWGLLFAKVFGPSFTSLTAATMCMSLLATITLYVLLRRVGFEPGLSGLGATLLALNPYFVVLSYSYMTEITFVSLMLLTCLCYFEGLSGKGDAWLWLGSLFAALTFLTRQFGLALPLAVVLWLLYARKLSWSRLASVALVPTVATIGYFAWSSGLPPTLSGSVGREELVALVRDPSAWPKRAAHFVYLAAFLPGLAVPIFGRVRHWKLVTFLSLGAALVVYGLWQVKTSLVQQGQSTLDDLSYSWLEHFWPSPTLVYCVGTALTVWLVAVIVDRSWPGFVGLLRRTRGPASADLLYLVATILFVGTFVVSLGFLDRYWLPILPFLIAGGLLSLKGRPLRALAPVMLVFAPVAVYGIAMHLDDYDALTTRWQAGHDLIAQGVPYEKLENGYTWDAYYLYDKAVETLSSHDIGVVGRIFPPEKIIDPEYTVGTEKQPGYEVLKTYPYFSRLSGFTTRQLLVLVRTAGSPGPVVGNEQCATCGMKR